MNAPLEPLLHKLVEESVDIATHCYLYMYISCTCTSHVHVVVYREQPNWHTALQHRNQVSGPYIAMHVIMILHIICI